MPEIPKIARERLRASRPVTSHPVPDLLTAFAEQALPGPERDAVLEHLARCGECREVVALALPPAESVEADAKTRPGRPGWLSLPVLRWGVVAAAAVVVVAAVGVRQWQQHKPLTVASQVKPAETDNKVADARPQGAEAKARFVAPRESLGKEAEAVASKETTPAVPAPAAAGALVKTPPASAGGSTAGVAGARSGEKGTLSADSSNEFRVATGAPRRDLYELKEHELKKPAAPAVAGPVQSAPARAQQNAPASASEVVEVQTEAQTAQTSSQDQTVALDKLTRTEREPTAQEQASLETAERVAKAKPSVTPSLAAAAPAASAPATDAKLGDLSPLWSISSTGTLLRSSDGTAWQEVQVDASHAWSAHFGSAEIIAKDSNAAKKGDKQQQAKRAGANTVFRAVAAAGLEVWAGGSAGLLYHSADGGASWTQVVPSSSGVALTGDITHVEFSDPQHGRIATSTAEVWTTSDRGQTWQKQ